MNAYEHVNTGPETMQHLPQGASYGNVANFFGSTFKEWQARKGRTRSSM